MTKTVYLKVGYVIDSVLNVSCVVCLMIFLSNMWGGGEASVFWRKKLFLFCKSCSVFNQKYLFCVLKIEFSFVMCRKLKKWAVLCSQKKCFLLTMQAYEKALYVLMSNGTFCLNAFARCFGVDWFR